MNSTKIFVALALYLCQVGLTRAQTPLPYTTGFDNAAQQTGWQLFRLGVSGGTNPYWVFSTSSPFSAPTCLSHNYPVGGTDPTDNWFVSPQFNFADGATIDSIRRSFSGFGKPAPGDTVALYLLSGDPDPSKASGRMLLYDYRDTAYSNDNTWYKTRPINIPATAGKSYIAFRYRTVVNWLDVRFDNLSVSRKIPARTESDLPVVRQLGYYPNPVRDILYITSPIPVQEVKIYDAAGSLLIALQATPRLDMRQLPAGTYLLHTLLNNGSTGYTKIVKE